MTGLFRSILGAICCFALTSAACTPAFAAAQFEFVIPGTAMPSGSCKPADAGLVWNSPAGLKAGTLCTQPSDHPQIAGCASQGRFQYRIQFKDRGYLVYADALQLGDNGVLHFQADLQMGHGLFTKIASVDREYVCKPDLTVNAPPSFCMENRPLAVNFSYDSPLPNRILTRGFSFYLEADQQMSASDRDATRAMIRDAFGTALIAWMSGLWDRQNNYDPALATLLSGMASKSSSGFAMFTGPQVVALDCPQSATFIVKVFRKHRGPFASTGKNLVKVAYAAKPGRTVLLNYLDYPCWKSAPYQDVLDDTTGCLNMVPILVHELGHAFGLSHVLDSTSIMSPVISAKEPLPEDLDRLAAQLLRKTNGAPAGMIKTFDEDGVSVRRRVMSGP